MINDQKLGTTELLYQRAQAMGLEPSWLTSNGLFVITVAGEDQYVNFARSHLNSHISASLSQDKHLARLVLERNGFRNIPFARPKTQAEAANFLNQHRKIVAKPVCGSNSHDIHIITKPSQLRALDISGYILEQYVAGREMRYLVLEGEVIGVHQSDYGTSVAETRSLIRISFPRHDWDSTLVTSSIQVARVLGLGFAAVDYLIDAEGRDHILEVNSRPGFKWFHSPTAGPVVDVAGLFLEAMLRGRSTLTQRPSGHKLDQSIMVR